MAAPVSVTLGGEVCQLDLPGYHVQHRCRDMWERLWPYNVQLEPVTGLAMLIPRVRPVWNYNADWDVDEGALISGSSLLISEVEGQGASRCIGLQRAGIVPSMPRTHTKAWFPGGEPQYIYTYWDTQTNALLVRAGVSVYFGGRYRLRYVRQESEVHLYGNSATSWTADSEYDPEGGWTQLRTFGNMRMGIPASYSSTAEPSLLVITPIPGGIHIQSNKGWMTYLESHCDVLTGHAMLQAPVAVGFDHVPGIGITGGVSYETLYANRGVVRFAVLPDDIWGRLTLPVTALGNTYDAPPTVQVVVPPTQPPGTTIYLTANKGNGDPFTDGNIQDFTWQVTLATDADWKYTPYFYGVRVNFEPTHQIIPPGL